MTEPQPNLVSKLADDDACATAIRRVGELDGRLAEIEKGKSAAVMRVSNEWETKATPLTTERSALAQSIEAYCTEHRARLTDNGKSKTATFTTGKTFWRRGKQTVEVVEELKAKIIAALKKKGLGRMVRQAEEFVDKTAVAREANLFEGRSNAIKGLTIVPGAEKFGIEPTGADLMERSPT